MSWLGGHWYGVLAFFGIPAILGILCWIGIHAAIVRRARHERAREARRRPPPDPLPQAYLPQDRLPGPRTSHRPF
ncbi:hypothetical protein [Acidisoma sp. C75]